MCMVYYLLVRDIIYTKYTHTHIYIYIYVCMYVLHPCIYRDYKFVLYSIQGQHCEWSEGNILACMGQILNNSTIAKLIIIFSQVYA